MVLLNKKSGIEIIKRYLSLFNIKILVVYMGFIILVILGSELINGVWFNLLGLMVGMSFVLLLNGSATNNMRWVVTGQVEDKKEDILTSIELELRELRSNDSKKLFDKVGNKYYYYDDGYK